MKEVTSPTLCTELWNHAVVDLSQNKLRTCCKTEPITVSGPEIESLGQDIFLNHPKFVAARSEMIAGGKPERCHVCWMQEEKGHHSFRRSAESWHHYFKPFESKIQDLSLSHFPDNLDIQLDNYCDLKCLYCNEEFSSQWQNEKLRFGDKVDIRSPSVNPTLEKNFFRWFETVKDHLKRVAFLGGEPLISPIFYDYFERILRSYQGNYPESLAFNIITNLNTPSVTLEKFIRLLETYSGDVEFNVNISMEAWGEQAEHIRAGVDFDRFKRNFERLASLDHRITLSTITSVNLLCLPSLGKYLEFVTNIEESTKRKIILYGNLVVSPEWLNVELAHPAFYQEYVEPCIGLLKDDLRHSTYVNFLKGLRGNFKFDQHRNGVLHQRFLTEMKKLGERRNVSYPEVFKEYAYLWTENSER